MSSPAPTRRSRRQTMPLPPDAGAYTISGPAPTRSLVPTQTWRSSEISPSLPRAALTRSPAPTRRWRSPPLQGRIPALGGGRLFGAIPRQLEHGQHEPMARNWGSTQSFCRATRPAKPAPSAPRSCATFTLRPVGLKARPNSIRPKLTMTF